MKNNGIINLLVFFGRHDCAKKKRPLFLNLTKQIGLRQMLMFFFLIWALLVAPTVLKAEPAKKTAEVNGFFSQQWVEGRRVFEIKFTSDMTADRELIFKQLKEEELPFRFSRPLDFKVFWKSPRILRLEPQLTNFELEDALDKNALDLIWKKDFTSSRGGGLEDVFTTSASQRTSLLPLVFSSFSKNSRGENYNRISLKPFELEVYKSDSDNYVSIMLSFNRLMVEADQVGKLMDMNEAPFSLEPPLPLKGKWRDQNTLFFDLHLSQADFWEKVSDIPFTVKWKTDLKNLHGQVLKGPKAKIAPFYFSKFKYVGFEQAGMNIDNWADFDLTFNKPVKKSDLSGRVHIEKFVYEKGRTISYKSYRAAEGFLPAEFKILDAPPEINSDGTAFKVQVKAGHGERIILSLGNLKSADGRGLISSARTDKGVDRFFTISDTAFKVEEEYPWRTSFTVNVREELNFDGLEKYISLDPPLDFVISPYGQEGRAIQIFAPFSADAPTKLVLKKGLPSRRGVLTEDVEYRIVVPANGDRRLKFTGRGRYLSPGKDLLIKLAGRNVGKVRLQAWRVYENNLPTIINIQEYDQNTRLRLAQQFSANLLNLESETQASPGQAFERLINLKGLLDGQARGAYILKCTPLDYNDNSPEYDEYYWDDYYGSHYDYADYYYHAERYLPVMISDIGLSAHVLPGRVSVWANSLSASSAVPNGRIKIYDSANQVLAEGLTDAEGLFSAVVDIDRMVFITAEKDGDLNYLTFGNSARSSSVDEDYPDNDYYDEYDRPQWHENGNAKWYGGDGGYLSVTAPSSPFGPARKYLHKGYEAFLFMARDMFKPGETIKVKAIVRDKDIAPPAVGFPVIWRLNDPDGKTLSQGQAKLNEDGAVDFSAEIPFFARTGPYEASISIPASARPLGQVKFVVEDFVPPRLALEIKPEEKIYHGQNPDIMLQADVKYLFGAPGANLNWELDAVIFPTAFQPKGWSGFDFSSPESDFETTRQPGTAKGTLDELGRAEVIYSPGLDIDRLPNKTSIEFVFSAQEDGGRWNAKKARVDYFPRDLILGAKLPASPLVNEAFGVEAAAVTPLGQAAEKQELTVRVFRVMTRYFNSYRYGRHYRQATEELVEKSVQRLALHEGKGKAEYLPTAAGAYEIQISDEDSGQTLRRRVYVYGLASDKEALSAKAPVEISFDREHYLPGGTAKVKVKSPFAGRLWLTLETNEVLYSIARELDGTEIELDVPVDKKLKTNAQLTATVVRPVGQGQTVFRAVGVSTLEIDRSISKLNLTAEIPERIKPSASSTLRLKVTDHQGRPVRGEATVALVDEGVLSLSNFKTPEPWRFFLAGRSLATRFYDLYDQLLPLELNTIPFLAPGGGDGLGRSGLFSPFKRNQEILSIFLPSVKLDANGEAAIDLDLPEYSGQGRLMVVASSLGSFGSLSRNIRISRDLTAEATLPLALAPGDRFEIPLRLMLSAEAGAEAGLEAKIKCRTEGPLRLLGESSAQLDLAPGEAKSTVFRAAAEPADSSGDQAGVGRLIIDSLSGAGESFSQTIEVVVRPPYPRISKSIGFQTEEAETAITIDASGFLKGTAEASLTLAKSAAVESARAVGWLGNYPYGCLEQTTSKAWVFVAADDMLLSLKPQADAERNIFHGINTAVQRLISMQTPSGGFATWPGGKQVYDWGSVYAAHFLHEAGNKIELPRNIKDRAGEWMREYLRGGYGYSSEDASYVLSTKAYALYVLALNGEYESGWYNSLRDRYDGLSPSARIFLAGAQALRDGNSNALMELEKAALDRSYSNLSARRSSLDSPSRNQALKLLVWAEVDPLNDITKKLAAEVSAEGRLNLWRNTQENGLAVLALSKYLNKSALGKPYQASLTGPGGQLLLAAGPADTASLGPEALAPWLNKKMNLKIEGEGRPYYSLSIGGVPLAPPAAKADRIKLSRHWIIGDKRIALTSEDDLKETLALNKGERVTVEITADLPESIQNMVLVDILPGGFEIENPRLVQPSEDSRPETEAGENELRLEMREDRLVLIEAWAERGRKIYRYRLRAVTSGEFALPGTTAEGMYEPDRQAILPGGRVRVK